MMDKNILVTNIQRFSLHDGPGIRTTVFLKGCLLRCPWCQNPENIRKEIDTIEIDGMANRIGYYISEEELFLEIMKDYDFYSTEGGVTFSGGEPLLSIMQYRNLLNKLKEKGISVCFETSLYVEKEQLEIAIAYADIIYADMKILNKTKFKQILNGDIAVYLGNLYRLDASECEYVIRIPLIGDYTDTNQNVDDLLAVLRDLRTDKVEIICGHNLGREKYDKLGLQSITVRPPNRQRINDIKSAIEMIGKSVLLCEV